MKKIIFVILILLLLGILKIVVYDILIASYFIKNNVEEFVEQYTPKEGDFLYKDLPENIRQCLEEKGKEGNILTIKNIIHFTYYDIFGYHSMDPPFSLSIENSMRFLLQNKYLNTPSSYINSLLYTYYISKYPEVYIEIYLNDLDKKRWIIKKKYEIFPELPVIYGVQVPKDYEGPQDYDTNPSYVQYLSEWRIYWDSVAKEYGYKDFTEEDFLEIFPYCNK